MMDETEMMLDDWTMGGSSPPPFHLLPGFDGGAESLAMAFLASTDSPLTPGTTAIAATAIPSAPGAPMGSATAVSSLTSSSSSISGGISGPLLQTATATMGRTTSLSSISSSTTNTMSSYIPGSAGTGQVELSNMSGLSSPPVADLNSSPSASASAPVMSGGFNQQMAMALSSSLSDTEQISSPQIQPPCDLQISGITQKSMRVETQLKLSLTLVPKAKVSGGLKWRNLVLPQELCLQQGQPVVLDPSTSLSLSVAVFRHADIVGPQGIDGAPEVECCVSCFERERRATEKKKNPLKKKFSFLNLTNSGSASASAVPPSSSASVHSAPGGPSSGSQLSTSASNAGAASTQVVGESPTESLSGQGDAERRNILSFCSESIRPLSNSQVVLPIRIKCYCSHHEEKRGFCLHITLEDVETNAVVASATTDPIMVRDDHKGGERKRKRPKLEDDPSPGPPVATPAVIESRTGFLFPPQTPKAQMTPLTNTTSPGHPFLLQQQTSLSPRPDKSPLSGNPAISVPQQQPIAALQLPRIVKIAPNQGPVTGGITVLVAGSSFSSGQRLHFGPYIARDTQEWGSGTLMCTLPPANSEGPVAVTVNGIVPTDCSPPVFLYKDDADVKLFALALQLVGMKLNGKVDSPQQVALSIIQGSSGTGQSSPLTRSGTGGSASTRDYNVEGMVLRALSVAYRFDTRYEMDLRLKEPQSEKNLLHLSACRGYTLLGSWLIKTGGRELLSIPDGRGYTPLHYASFYNQMKFAEILVSAGADKIAIGDDAMLPQDLAKSDIMRDFLQPPIQIRSTPPTKQSPPSVTTASHAGEIYVPIDGNAVGSSPVREGRISSWSRPAVLVISVVMIVTFIIVGAVTTNKAGSAVTTKVPINNDMDTYPQAGAPLPLTTGTEKGDLIVLRLLSVAGFTLSLLLSGYALIRSVRPKALLIFMVLLGALDAFEVIRLFL